MSSLLSTSRDWQPVSVRWLSGAFPALVAVGLVVITTSCREQHVAAPPPPPIVQVMDVTMSNVPRSVVFIGQLDSPQNVEVRARVEGFVEKVLFAEGSDVQAGDPLFALDRKPFEENLAAAMGVLAEANAALNKSKADVARLTPLAKAKAIPLQDLDSALAAVAVGEANVLSAQAKVKSAEFNLGYCDVKAPVAGRIGAKAVSVGSLVGKGEPTLLATISQLDPIDFSCAISTPDYMLAERVSREAGRKIGSLPVTLLLEDGAEHPTPGKWVFLDRAVDVTTGTIRARAEFANPEKILRPGMFARVRLSLHNKEGNILVPERALVELQGKNFVWIVGSDNRATQRSVQVAPIRIGENVVVLDGLKAGERIVVEGLQKVRDGKEVKPMTAAQAAEAVKQAEAKPAQEGAVKHGKE